MRKVILTGFVALFIGLPCHSAKAESDTVGPLGDPACLVFEGNETFSDDEIRTAVAKDVRLLLASHPNTALTSYLRLLEERLVAGYGRGGFPDAAVSAEADTARGRVTVTIREGKRYSCGKVVFEGVQGLPVRAIEDILGRRREDWERIPVLRDNQAQPDSNPDPSGENPIWVPGEPVDFSDGLAERVRARVNDAILTEAARLEARFDVDLLRRDADAAADLVIRFHDPGRQLKVSNLRFTGNLWDSREDILRFLSLAEGESFTGDAFKSLRANLYDSGRFQKVEMAVSIPRYGDEREITVTLIDHECAPALSEPLSKEAEALFRFRDWLENPDRWGGDIVIRAYGIKPIGMEVTAILGQDGGYGFFARREVTPPNAATDHKKTKMDYVVHMAPQRTAIWAPSRQCKYVAGRIPNIACWSLRMTPLFEPEKTCKICLGVGAFCEQGRERNMQYGSRPVPWSIRVDPPVFFRILKNAPDCRLEHGILHLKGETVAAQIDAGSGRLVELDIDANLEETDPFYGKMDCDGITLSIVPGALARAVATAESEARELPNYFDPDAPITSFVQFVADAIPIAEVDRRICRQIAENLKGSLLEKELVTMYGNKETKRSFWIPLRLETASAKNANGWLALCMPIAQYNPYGEWPWEFFYFLTAASLNEQALLYPACLEFINNKERGPLACWAAGYSLLRYPQLTRPLAMTGLSRLNEEAFLRDLALLEGRPFGETLVRLLQSFEADELERLRELAAPYLPFKPDDPIAYIGEHRNTDPNTFVRELGKLLWASGVKESLRESLEGLKEKSRASVVRNPRDEERTSPFSFPHAASRYSLVPLEHR